MSDFVRIKRSEVEEWLTKNFGDQQGWTIAFDNPGREVVYDVYTDRPGIVYRFYSSLTSGADVTRGVGQDAIRFVLFDTYYGKPLGKTKRVHRTEGATTVWERMLQRIEELHSGLRDITYCPNCGHVMVQRNGRFGEFFGCAQYPECKGTRQLKNRGQGIGDRLALQKKMEENDVKPVTKLKRRKQQTTEVESLDGGGVGAAETILSDSTDGAEDSSAGPEEVPISFDSTKIFPLIDYPFESFQPIQGALAKVITQPDWDENIVCTAPTGAGKTVLAEMGIVKELVETGLKAVYASPFKALTQEKLDEWLKTFADYKISIVTGDYTLTQKRVKELREANIILLTTEMLDSRTRRMEAEKNDWLLNVGVVVVDEFHIITMKDRGDKVESGLMRFCAINPKAKIIGISATMPNVDELAQWLTKLNGKRTTLLRSSWRPVNLNIHAVPYYGQRYWDQESEKMSLALSIIDEHPGDKFLVFVHAKRQGRELMNALTEKGISTNFHSADLDLKDRLEIEASFKDRQNGIRVLVSTSTTAWGVNLPARRCIIYGVTRGLSPVDIVDVIQEIGRSGRPGLDPEGDAYILCPASDMDPLGGPSFWGNIVQHCPPIRSQMLEHKVLGFHICAELGRKPMSLKSIKLWYSRSLAFHQGMELADEVIEPLMKDLVNIGVVEFDPSWNTYKLTGLGRVSAWLYYDPWSVAAWYKNFDWLFKAQRPLKGTYDKPISEDLAMAVCLGNVPAYEMEYVPKDFELRVSSVAHLFSTVMQPFRAGCGVMMLAIADMLSRGEISNGLQLFWRQVAWDATRIVQALKLIDGQHGKWGRQKWFDVLGLRVKYGVPEDLVELVEIEGIGAARAKKLAYRKVKNLQDFLENKAAVRKVLGPALYKKAMESAKELAKEKGLEN